MKSKKQLQGFTKKGVRQFVTSKRRGIRREPLMYTSKKDYGTITRENTLEADRGGYADQKHASKMVMGDMATERLSSKRARSFVSPAKAHSVERTE